MNENSMRKATRLNDPDIFIGSRYPMTRCPAEFKRNKRKAKAWQRRESKNLGLYKPAARGRPALIFINPKEIWDSLNDLLYEHWNDVIYMDHEIYVLSFKPGQEKHIDNWEKDEDEFFKEFAITMAHEFLHHEFHMDMKVRRWLKGKPGNVRLKEEPFIEKIEAIIAWCIYEPLSGPRWHPF